MKTKNYLLIAAATILCACTDNNNIYDASGIFETTEVIVSAQGTGEIISFQLEEGENVRANEILGCIDTTQLFLKKAQLTASMSATDCKRLNVERQISSLRRQMINLQKEKKRYSALLNDNATTKKQVDDIDYQIGVLQSQISATKEQIANNNSSLSNQKTSISTQVAQIDNQIGNSIITSPISGTIICKYTEQGEYTTPGRVLFKVSNMKHIRLRAYITADQLTDLKLGQKVKVFADSGKDKRKEYDGILTWISDKAEFTPKTIQTRNERANLVYAIKIDVFNDGFIKRGMYGDVKF